MNLRNIEYLIQEAFVGIWRNGIMAVASISTVALSMAILGTFVLMVLGSNRFVNRQLEKFEIAVYMPDGATQLQAEQVRDEIRKLNLAKKAELLSRDKEWADFRKKLSVRTTGIERNPLPYKISVESSDPTRTNELADRIKNLEVSASSEDGRTTATIKGLDVDDGRSTYTKVRKATGLFRVLSLAASIILCLTTTFIISNAIRLTVFARRHEIRIMQLVGATNWFIRVPLVMEGIVIGALGAMVAYGLIALGAHFAENLQRDILFLLRDVSSGTTASQQITGLAVTGAVIGAMGSLISIRRFLRV